MEKTIIFWEKKKNNLICEKIKETNFWEKENKKRRQNSKKLQKIFLFRINGTGKRMNALVTYLSIETFKIRVSLSSTNKHQKRKEKWMFKK